jgi:hypothetical protein
MTSLAAYFQSDPSDSLQITPPSAQGGGYTFAVNTSVASNPSGGVSTTYTPGTASVPPNYSFAISPTAVTSSDSSVSVNTAGGNFVLGVLGSLVTNINQTIIVGGVIGKLPNAVDIATAVSTYATQLATATSTSPWTLLLLPGTYTSSSAVTIPLNVNIVGFLQDTAFINHSLTITDATANTTSMMMRSIVLGATTSGISITTTGKTGGTFSYVLRDCDVRSGGSLSFTMRGITTGNYYQDSVKIVDSNIVTTSSLALSFSGGITNFQTSRIRILTGSFTLIAPSTGVTRVQALDSTISIPVVQNASSFFSLRGCILGCAWSIGQTVSTNTTLLITSCRPNTDSNAVLTNPWLLSAYGTSVVVLTKTFLSQVLTRALGNQWNITFPNLVPVTSGTQAPIDRPFRTTLLNPPSLLSLGTVDLDLDIPLSTALEASAPATGVQPQVTQAQMGNSERTQLAASTTSDIAMGLLTDIASGDKVTMEVIPPSYSGIAWYHP